MVPQIKKKSRTGKIPLSTAVTKSLRSYVGPTGPTNPCQPPHRSYVELKSPRPSKEIKLRKYACIYVENLYGTYTNWYSYIVHKFFYSET